MLQVWNSQKLFHVMARCNLKKYSLNQKLFAVMASRKQKNIFHQTGGRMEQDNTCVHPKKKNNRKNKGVSRGSD